MSSIKLKHSGGNSVSLNPPTSAPTSSDVAFKLPNADGSADQVIKTDGSGNLGFVAQPTAGITMADSWGLSSGSTLNSNDYLTSNWVRRTGTTNSAEIGSAMTESSGVFTFPATGKYLMLLTFGLYTTNNQDFAGVKVHSSTDGGSSFSITSTAYTHIEGSDYGRLVLNEIYDVSDASNFKIKFQFELAAACSIQSGQGRTSMIIIRLGDT